LGLSNRQNKGRSKSKSNNSYSNPGNTSHFSSSSSFDFSLCNLSKISAVMKSRRREKKKNHKEFVPFSGQGCYD
jgi:hypothetical protein